jgi:DeoR family fructose operon transcriptional repressor
MYAAERHQRILGRARSEGRVAVRDLAESFDVTPETVRRDLARLAQQGAVRRVHGGAVVLTADGHGGPDATCDGAATGLEERIALRALAELPDGGSILLDAGSATARLARMLPSGPHLTVVTHALPVATLLATRPDITLHVLGGTVRRPTLAAMGDWIRRSVADVSVDVAFVGTAGVARVHGLTARDLTEAEVTRSLVRAATRTVVLAGHAAFGHVGFAHVVPLSEVDLVITDPDAADDLVADVERGGTTVVRA